MQTSGLERDQDGVLKAAEPGSVVRALEQIWQDVLARISADVAFVEDEAGPRLEFRRADIAYSYIVYFRQDWSGDPQKMRGAMMNLADKLGLARFDATWTLHAE